MNYGIVIFPSKELQDKANSYRKRYDTNYALIKPHITLKASFEAADSEIERIAAEIKEITAQIQPFTLKVLKASTFQPVNNTIYFKVEPVPELEALHKAFNDESFAGSPSPFNFVPHITIAQNLSDNEHNDVFGQLSMLDLSYEEQAGDIQLVRRADNGIWSIYKTFKLGKESS